MRIQFPYHIITTTITGQPILMGDPPQHVRLLAKDFYGSLTVLPSFPGNLKGAPAIDLYARTGKWLREIPTDGDETEVEVDDDIVAALWRALTDFKPHPQVAHCLEPLINAIRLPEEPSPQTGNG